jgi:PBP1b-binding outer membrane lipoprotein LpoB
MQRVTQIVLSALLLFGCGSTPEERKQEAEAEQIEQKTKTIEEYKECVKDADQDAAKLDTCERLLKAAGVQSVSPAVAPESTAPAQ